MPACREVTQGSGGDDRPRACTKYHTVNRVPTPMTRARKGLDRQPAGDLGAGEAAQDGAAPASPASPARPRCPSATKITTATPLTKAESRFFSALAASRLSRPASVRPASSMMPRPAPK